MTDEVVGGCKCGLVRYKGARADTPMFRCHCRDCQQLTGTGHSEMMPVLTETFTIGDACKTYELIGGSGRPIYSSFCPNCGSQLTRRSERMNDRIGCPQIRMDSRQNRRTCHCPSASLTTFSTCPFTRPATNPAQASRALRFSSA